MNGAWGPGCDSAVSGRGHARYYTFSVSRDSEVSITLESEDADTYLYLREGEARSGAHLHENDDHEGSTGRSRIEERLPAGTYTIEATTYGEGETGSFILTVRGLGVAAPDPGAGDCGERLSGDGSVNGAWGPGCDSAVSGRGQARYYTFSVSRDSEVSITLESEDADTYLYLREGEARSGAHLHENDDHEGSTSRSRIEERLPAGTYTIEATTYGEGETGSFILTVRGLGVAAPDPGAGDCGERLSGDGSVNGAWGPGCDSAVSGRGQARYYTFSVSRDSEVSITLESEDADTYLYLREGEVRSGAYLHENDDHEGSTSRSRIEERLPAGAYTIEATTYEEGETGSFILTVRGLGGITTTDRIALVALYNTTNGANWRNNSGWLTDAPIGTWYGVTANGSGRVVELSLLDNQLSGQLPAELGNLTSLEYLRLYSNQLSGELPVELGNLISLRAMQLANNRLNGGLPAEWGNLTSLELLSLHRNHLSGEIPAALGNLTSLKELDLPDNRFSGEIPAELGNLTDLEFLSLHGNRLIGNLPAELGNLRNLTELFVHGNQLTGGLPLSLTELTLLQHFSFHSNASLCASDDATIQAWLDSIAIVDGVDCSDLRGSPDRPVFEGGIDLGVTHLERLPRYERYRIAYFYEGECSYPYDEFLGAVVCPEQEGAKRWPDVGEPVNLIAHVRNFGDTRFGRVRVYMEHGRRDFIHREAYRTGVWWACSVRDDGTVARGIEQPGGHLHRGYRGRGG